MPKHVWSAWSQGPPPPSPPWHHALQQYRGPSTWDANFTTRSAPKSPKPAAKSRPYRVCRDRGCGGWSYVDRNDVACRKCGCEFDGPEIAPTTSSKIPVDKDHFQKLAEDDPSRITLQKLIDAGHAAFDEEDEQPEGDLFEACRKQVGVATAALVKAQNLQNHARSQARACREKLLKLEAEEKKAEQDFLEKTAAHGILWKKFEAMAQASKASAAKHITTDTEATPPSEDSAKVVYLEQEVARLSKLLESFMGLGVAQAGGGALVAAPAATAATSGEDGSKRRKINKGDGSEATPMDADDDDLIQSTDKQPATQEAGKGSSQGTEATLAAAKAAAEAAAALIAKQAKEG